MSFNGSGLPTPSAQHLLVAVIANSALAMLIGSPVGICLIKFMSSAAMRFGSTVWRHCQSLPKAPPFGVKHLLKRESFCSSLHDCVYFQTANVGKDAGLIFYAFYNHLKSDPSISHLLFAGSPLAILRRIRAVVVNAFNRETDWPFSHILNKGREAISPAVAYCYSPPAVILIRSVSRIQAALTNANPCAIKLMSAKVMLAFSLLSSRFIHADILTLCPSMLQVSPNAV